MINKIEIKQADKVLCSKEWSWVSDTNGWSGYHLWYVESGKGYVQVEEKYYDLYGGDCFCFDLTKNHICNHNQENPLVVYTVYLDVDSCPIQLKRRIIRNDLTVGYAIKRAVEEYNIRDQEQSVLWVMAVLQSFINPKVQRAEIPERIATVCTQIEEHMDTSYSLEQLSEISGYSKNQIIRLFKQQFDLTPVQYITKAKMEQAKKMMLYSNMNVTEIAYSVGYEEVSYFIKVFKKYAGESPKEYRERVNH